MDCVKRVPRCEAGGCFIIKCVKTSRGIIPARLRDVVPQTRRFPAPSIPITWQKERKKTRERFGAFTQQGLHDLLEMLHLPLGGKKVRG